MNDSAIHDPEWNDLKAPATYTRLFMNGRDEIKQQQVSDEQSGTATATETTDQQESLSNTAGEPLNETAVDEAEDDE